MRYASKGGPPLPPRMLLALLPWDGRAWRWIGRGGIDEESASVALPSEPSPGLTHLSSDVELICGGAGTGKGGLPLINSVSVHFRGKVFVKYPARPPPAFVAVPVGGAPGVCDFACLTFGVGSEG